MTLLSFVDWDPVRPLGSPYQDRCGKVKTGSATLGLLSPRLLSSAFRYGVHLDWREGWGWPIILSFSGHMCRGVGKGRFGILSGKRGHGPILCTSPGCWLAPTPSTWHRGHREGWIYNVPDVGLEAQARAILSLRSGSCQQLLVSLWIGTVFWRGLYPCDSSTLRLIGCKVQIGHCLGVWGSLRWDCWLFLLLLG